MPLPKGPFRTKNTTTIAKLVNYYAVVFLLRPPNLLRRGPFFERKNVCKSKENGVRTRRAAIVNQPAVLKILRVVNLLRVVSLVRRSPLGIQNYYPRNYIFSELIGRGVIYYAGNFLPQFFLELIMRGNSVSHYVDRPVFWGVKKLLQKSNH